jgi:beta-galactosidase
VFPHDSDQFRGSQIRRYAPLVPLPQSQRPHPLFIAGVPGWSQPTVTGIGRLPSRAPLVPYPNADQARGASRTSPWVRSLNGVWNFRLRTNPIDVTWADVSDEGPEWEPIAVPGPWNDARNFGTDHTPGLHPDRGLPHYTNVLMPFDEEPPFGPLHNPTGVYRNFFDVPANWADRRTVLQLGGTDSMHYVFVNGVAAGVGTDTRVTSEYDITPYMREGTNTLVIVVVRWTSNSWLEDQDQWWMSGITRDVHLLSLAPTHIQHVRATTNAKDPLSNAPVGTLDAEVHVAFGTGSPPPGWSVRCRLENLDGTDVHGYLRADDSYPGPFLPGRIGGAQPGQVDTAAAVDQVQDLTVLEHAAIVPILDRRSPARTAMDGNVFPGHRVRFHAEVPNAQLWSTEDPHRYRLLCELIDIEGTVTEAVAQLIGFRSVEVRNREMLLNGKPVLIRGVNRHDHDEINACSPSRSTMRLDLEMMKRFNVNAVRMSHYPPDPYILDVCDELGLWVIDETNLETHARFRSLVHDPAYQSQCLERITRMVMRDENHPSIIAWSLGNESGYGPIHDAMAAWVRHYDPSRLVHYEGPHRYDLGPHGRVATDIVAPMYPSMERIEQWAHRQATAPDDDRPMILCEYSHAMGNSNGSLADHDNLFRAYHGLQGGFIWEWIDHGLRIGTGFDGRSVWAYGGHFGDQPNDGAFVADGLVWPDRTPHPGLWEAAHVWRPVRVALSDSGELLIANDRDFTTLADLQCTYEVLVNGTAVELGSLDIPDTAPGSTISVALPGAHLSLGEHEEGHVTLRWSTRQATRWCGPNHVVAWDQVALPAHQTQPSALTTRGIAPGPITLDVIDDHIMASGASTVFEHTIDGTLQRILVGSDVLLADAPEFRVWRARIDNDGVPAGQLGLPGIGQEWDKWGLRQSSVKTVSDVSRMGGVLDIRRSFTITPSGAGGASIEVDEHRSIANDGTVVYTYKAIVPDALGDLPRLGTVFPLTDIEQLEWFGLGPLETYADRRSAATVGRWKSTVTDQYVPYIHPQDHGRHEATRWVHVHNGRVGLVAAAHPGMRLFSFSARHFDDGELSDAATSGELIPRAKTILSIDHRVRGVGTGSCGPDSLPTYRIGAGQHEWSFAIRTWVLGQDPAELTAGIVWPDL